jgi:malonyl CoA-acyl carrier protein transacylase
MSTAVIFPGQGSQVPEMRERVAAARPDLLAAVTRAVGEDPFLRVDESTRFAQPAILCASLAAWSEHRPHADLLAGHSLGEIGALAAAGALSEEDALRLVAARGRLMDEAGDAAGGDGSMIALVGRGAAEAAPEIAERTGLAVANDNAPEQVVLSGSRSAFAAAKEQAKAHKLRALELPVAGAFHSPMMATAVPALRAVLADTDVRRPRITVISAVTAAPIEDVRATLADAIVKPVRWRETLHALYEQGARRFVEIGPGRVLTGLVRRTLTDVEAGVADEPEVAHA